MFLGKRPIRSLRGEGEFFCPQCYQTRQGKFQVVYQYATLMMLPLFRVGSPEKSVVCSTCNAVFSEAILEYNPHEADRQFAAEVFRINVLMAMVEGSVEPAEITTLQRLYTELTGADLSREDIENEVRRAYEDELDAAEMVRQIGRSLGGEGAKIVAQQAYQVASASGSISEKRQTQLDQFPEGLGISAEAFQRLMHELSSPTEGGASPTDQAEIQEPKP